MTCVPKGALIFIFRVVYASFEFGLTFEKECTEYDANVIELDWKDGYYHYSFVVMSGMLKDQSNRFSYDDDHDWDDMDPSSDWDEYDEDGTHYTDFPEKYGYDRDYFS